MNQTQTLKPVKLNMDINPKELPADSAFYILNQEVAVNPNGGANGGASLGKQTPYAANKPACEVDQPAGENYTILKYDSVRSNETYSGVYNSNGVNYIQRINAKGECEIVYHGDCLKFSAAPRHSIEDWRCWMRIEKVCKNRSGKYLQFVDGNGNNCYIDTEASIATNFFTTPFFDICPDPCAYINLCVPQPCGCLKAEFISVPFNQQALSNNILDRAFKFMFKHVYYDGRESEWSDRSTLYFLDSSKCYYNSSNLSIRCMKLRIPIGNPMVDRIKVGVSEDGGYTWYVHETIEKYKKYNSSQDMWYDRELSEIITGNNFSLSDCSFDYQFCNDKERVPISPEQVSRVRNPYPRNPQFIFPIDEAVAFGNFEDGNCPIDKTEIEKVQINLDCATYNCDTEYSTVTIRAVLNNNNNNAPIYTLGTRDNAQGEIDEVVYWGDNSDGNPAYPEGQRFGQRFKDKCRNFIAYIEGTDYWGEMKQWHASPGFTNRLYKGVLRNLGEQAVLDGIYHDVILNGNYYYQEFVFKVPKGTQGFIRLVSHESTDGSISSQNTSTRITGTVPISLFRGNNFGHWNGAIDIGKREVFFDTCNGDTDCGGQAFVIHDSRNVYTSVFDGYIKAANGTPVEGAVIGKGLPQVGAVQIPTTDHNGFYFFNKGQTVGANQWVPRTIFIPIDVELTCADFTTIQTFSVADERLAEIRQDQQIIDTSYNDNSYANVILKVKDCNDNPLEGITVALSGSKSRATNFNGEAIFRIRNYYTRNRSLKAVVMDSYGCFTQDCFGFCSPCMILFSSPTQACYTSIPTFSIGTALMNTASIRLRSGLKAGGVYPFGVVVEGDCGNLSAVNELMYLTIPKTQESNALSFCRLSYEVINNMILPSWAKCLKIVRGENQNNYELQWVIDKIERDANGKIILTIQSLNDYNAGYYFKTNTIYQWLEGDRIEFIRNGDDVIFSSAQYGILNYSLVSPLRDISIGDTSTTNPNYFNQLVIIDDGRLSNLKVGAIIELQRPKVHTTEIAYKEICFTIPVVQVPNGDGTTHGELLYNSGTFNTFDTFLVLRKLNSVIGLFEHHMPNDFYVNRLDDTGKVHFVNKYENQKRYGRSVRIASPTVVNYFSGQDKTFDAEEQGDIVAMRIVDDNIIQAICEHDNFLAQKANDLLRIDNSGVVKAQSPDNIISNPQVKPAGAYGCQYDHIGSILFGDGFATWADVDNFAFIKHDYNLAKDVSNGRVKLYTQTRFQEIEFSNSTATSDLDKLRFVTGQNMQSNAVFLTIKRLRDSGINNEKKPFKKTNDTIIYHPDADEFLGFASFTPEAYSQINLFDGKGASFVSYLNGKPYFHPVLTDKWNEFFGVACDWMVGISANQFPDKEKSFLSIEEQSETFFIIDSVETDKAGYLSEVPPKKFKKSGRKWNAGLMGNINSRGGLFGTEIPKGYYAKMLLIRDNSLLLAYQTIDDTKRIGYSELDEIFVKFAVVSQSGFTDNL